MEGHPKCIYIPLGYLEKLDTKKYSLVAGIYEIENLEKLLRIRKDSKVIQDYIGAKGGITRDIKDLVWRRLSSYYRSSKLFVRNAEDGYLSSFAMATYCRGKLVYVYQFHPNARNQRQFTIEDAKVRWPNFRMVSSSNMIKGHNNTPIEDAANSFGQKSEISKYDMAAIIFNVAEHGAALEQGTVNPLTGRRNKPYKVLERFLTGCDKICAKWTNQEAAGILTL